MTEKRFIMVKCIYNQWCIVDKTLEDDQIILLAGNKHYVKYIVDLLNDLHKENQSLKFQLDECRNNKLFSRRQLEEENEQLKKDAKYWQGSSRFWKNQESMNDIENDKLREENEQLKQAYTQLKHRHSLLHDVCIDAECDRDMYHKDVLSLEKENEQLKQALLFFLDIANAECSSSFEKDMEHDCQKLFNCSYDEAEKKYGSYDATWWELGE